jgi:membrane-associated phospholipid phosphatase
MLKYQFSRTFDYIGNFAPSLLLLLSIYLLLPNKLALVTLLAGYWMNLEIKAMLKHWAQAHLPSLSQRPVEYYHMFAIDLSDIYNDKSNQITHVYGMPSGHVQSVWFITMFIALTLKHDYITALYVGVSICTMIERVKYDNHTIQQVFAGMVAGILFAYVLYNVVLII